MGRRKRRQLKNKANRTGDSSDILFIGIPLIITIVLCGILVFGTFQRFENVPVSRQYESSKEIDKAANSTEGSTKEIEETVNLTEDSTDDYILIE